MSELKQELEEVLDNLRNNIDTIDDDLIEQLSGTIKTMLKVNPLSIIKRSSKYFPVGYVTLDRCYAKWLNDNVVEFYIEGWTGNYIQYIYILQYKYIEGYYYKIYTSKCNVNGKGQSISKTYQNYIALSEDQVLYEISQIHD